MTSDAWRWVLGLTFIVTVATIWIASSFVVQSVVDGGASPFLITYICNSLLIIYIPIVEISRYLEESVQCLWLRSCHKNGHHFDEEQVNLLGIGGNGLNPPEHENGETAVKIDPSYHILDAEGGWSRTRVAKLSLLLCPFWFLSYYCTNLSLKYTTVTSNTVLTSTSSLFTFLGSLVFLGEQFTYLKMISILLCIGGTVTVSLGDTQTGLNTTALKPLLGDILALGSACLYASFITIIRKNISNEDEANRRMSMAQLLGFLGLFNLFIFLPVPLLLNFTNLEPFHTLSWKQLGLITAKGLLDNVLSDYLWAKAVLLTTPTVATTGLTIEVPMAAIIDSVTGHTPRLMDFLGASAIMVGFVGISISSCDLFGSSNVTLETENDIASISDPSSYIER